MRVIGVLALLLVAPTAYRRASELVDRWTGWRLERAKRRFAAEDYEGSLADARAVLWWRPRSKVAELLREESLYRFLWTPLRDGEPIVVMPTCGISLPAPSGAACEGGGR